MAPSSRKWWQVRKRSREGPAKPSGLGRGDKVQLILNGKVAQQEGVRSAVIGARAQGFEIGVSVTWEAGDAERFAAEASRDEAIGTIIAGGGDGMLNSVVSGILSTDLVLLPRLAVLPLGTANDFARACRIPTEPLAALELALHGAASPVDVGRVNDRFFLNVATGGFGTDVTVNTPPDMKKLLGGAAYLLTGISQASSISARRAVIEGQDFSWSGGFLALAVGNGRYAGGGVPVTEHASIDNGFFDLSILPEVRVDQIPDVLRTLLDLGFSAEALDSHMIRARSHQFSILADEPLQINLDGEPLESRRFDFEVMDRAIRLHLPPDTDILSGH